MKICWSRRKSAVDVGSIPVGVPFIIPDWEENGPSTTRTVWVKMTETKEIDSNTTDTTYKIVDMTDNIIWAPNTDGYCYKGYCIPYDAVAEKLNAKMMVEGYME